MASEWLCNFTETWSFRDLPEWVSTVASHVEKKKFSSSLTTAPIADGLSSKLETLSSSSSVDVVVAGALAIDLSCDLKLGKKSGQLVNPQQATSNPAIITQNLGGVGQNVATTLHYLGTPVRLCSIVGNDFAGSSALAMLSARGLSISGIQQIGNGLRTAQYVAINNAQKDLFLAMADMNILETLSGFDYWKAHIHNCNPKWLIVDANWDETTLQKWIVEGKNSGAKVAYEPVSVVKSKRLFSSERPLSVVPQHSVDLTSPNNLELASMYAAAKGAGLFEREDWWQTVDGIGLSSSGSRDKLVAITNAKLVDEGVPQQSIHLLPFIPSIVTKLGPHGVLLTQLLFPSDDRLTSPTSAPYILSRSDHNDGIVGGVYMRLFPPIELVPDDEILSVNGVGDTFLGILVAGLVRESPGKLFDLIDVAQEGSVMTLKSKETVSPKIRTLHFP